MSDYNGEIALNPKFAKAFNNRSNLFAKSGQYQKAICDYKQTIAIDPNFASAYVNCGEIFVAIEQKDSAATCYLQAARIFLEKGELDNYQRVRSALNIL